MDEEKEIHKYWSDDRKRMAHVVYDKEFDGFVVMYENNKKIKSVPMSQAQLGIVNNMQRMRKLGYGLLP